MVLVLPVDVDLKECLCTLKALNHVIEHCYKSSRYVVYSLCKGLG